MARSIKKITVNVPQKLLETVTQTTGMKLTEAIIEGLKELEKREMRSALRLFKGKIAFDLNLSKTRK